MTILHSFLQWFQRSSDQAEAQKIRTTDSDRRLTSFLVLANLIVLLLLAFPGSENIVGFAFRCVLITLSFIGMGFLYSLSAGRNSFSNKTILVTSLIVCIHVALIVLLQKNIIPALGDAEPLTLYLIPYMFAPVLASVLLGRYLGAFATLCVIFYGAVLLPSEYVPPYMAISLVAGLTGVVLTVSLRKRNQILISGSLVGIVVFICATLFEILQPDPNAPLSSHIGTAAFCAFGVSIFMGIFIGGILPWLESLFNICTPITWLELGDMNHPLIKKLQLNAPGTFHHSIVVSRMAEAAAEAIGADATQCSVSALYHDIGKLAYPQFFAENISDFMLSPHNELTPEMSARKIIAHVDEGVALAEKYKLNSRIIDVIREHHGKTTASYFYYQTLTRYNEALKQFDEGLTDTKPDSVRIELFQYKGPRPQSRESGIISLADVAESATRSLKNPTPEEIEAKIDEVIKGRMNDDELSDSKLTFGDIHKIRNAFLITLKTMAHNRIAYPQKPGDAPREESSSAETMLDTLQEKENEKTAENIES